MTTEQTKITIICGRVQDLINQLNALMPTFITHHLQFQPQLDIDPEYYKIEIDVVDDILSIFIIYLDVDDGVVIGHGEWQANKLNLTLCEPFPYSVLFMELEEM